VRLPIGNKYNGSLKFIGCRGVSSWLLAAWLLLAGAGRGWAELGGDANTVAVDQRQMQGSGRIMRMSLDYAIHEYEANSGTLVREYVSPEGKVFGVAWQGPRIPDLGLLLGAYYVQYERAASAVRDERHRGPLVVQEPGLVAQSVERPRGVSGWAYVPGLLPVGVRAEEIR
jgi:hypothetical protein